MILQTSIILEGNDYLKHSYSSPKHSIRPRLSPNTSNFHLSTSTQGFSLACAWPLSLGRAQTFSKNIIIIIINYTVYKKKISLRFRAGAGCLQAPHAPSSNIYEFFWGLFFTQSQPWLTRERLGLRTTRP